MRQDTRADGASGVGPRPTDGSGGAGTVSVVMVSLDCDRLFDLVFPALLRQTHRPLEVIVVDNGSSAGSMERLRSVYPWVTVMALHRNFGFSHAANAGIRRARGEYILSLNFDIVLEPTFVERLVSAVQDDARIGWAAGCLMRLTDSGPTADIDCAGHHLTRSRRAHGFDLSGSLQLRGDAGGADVFGASACAALYRRTMLDDIAVDGEWFDEDFFAYYEDVDVDWRAQHRGWRCRYVPDAVGYHIRGGAGLIRRPGIAACDFSNRILMIVKNDSPSALLRDWYPVLRATVRDVVTYGFPDPRAAIIGIYRIVRYLPRMVKKREAIMARSLAGSGHFEQLIH